jgi:ubiquilin
VKGPSELKLSITISTSKSVAELKEVIAGKSDVEKDRQRLIYSGESAEHWAVVERRGVRTWDAEHADKPPGKVLKDEDPISQYKIQVGGRTHGSMPDQS